MNIFVRLGILILAIFQILLLTTSATLGDTSLKLQDAKTKNSKIEVGVGDIFDLNIMVDVGDKLVNGVSVFLSYDATYLEAQDADEEEKLHPFKTGAFLAGGAVLQNEQKGVEKTGIHQLNYTIGSLFGKVNGDGILASLSFKTLAPIRSTTISIDYEEDGVRKTRYSRVEPVLVEPFDLTIPATVSIRGIPRWDVNRDAIVDIADLVIVGRDFGSEPPANRAADVNEDGIIDIVDLVLVGKHFGEEYAPEVAGAPAMKSGRNARVFLKADALPMGNEDNVGEELSYIASQARCSRNLMPTHPPLNHTGLRRISVASANCSGWGLIQSQREDEW